MKTILLIIIGLSTLLHSELTRKGESVYDKETGLIWQDDSRVKTVKKNFEGAKTYCEDLDFEGKSNWRLPSIKELLTITDKNRYNPAISPVFKNITPNNYWSSSVLKSVFTGAWYVSFKYGYSNYDYFKTNIYQVLCVRAGQSSLTFENLVSKYFEEEMKSFPKPKVNVELIKDEFETSSEFDQRVKKEKILQKKQIEKYEKAYAALKVKAEKKAIKKALEVTWGKPILSDLHYDAENGYFLSTVIFEAKKDFKEQNIAIKVPRKLAREFKKDFSSLKPQAIFDYDSKSVKLKEIRVPFKKQKFLAQFTDASYDDTRVAVNISSDINLDDTYKNSKITVAKNDISHFDASKLKSFNDLDKLLAKTKQVKVDKKKWLFVIGIEQYEFTDNISYASRSATMFVKTTQKTMGISKENSYVMINNQASQARIKTNLKKMLRRVKKGDTIYFYYNGHGIPVPSKKNEPYLLAFNSEPDFIQDESFFALQNIYSTLSDSKAGKVIAVVDSCFSGVTDGKAVLKGVAATRVVAKRTKFNQDKMVVMSAGKGHQYSNAYNQKGHRLFSFYVMKNMLEGNKDIKTLYKQTKAQTYQTSLEEYGDGRTQEPTIEGNARLEL